MSIDRPKRLRAPTLALTRRRFLLATVQGSAALAIGSPLNACSSAQPAASPTTVAQAVSAAPQAAAGGFSGGGTLKMLVRSHFVPAFDTWIDQWAKDWGAKNKVEVQVDHTVSGELAAKI